MLNFNDYIAKIKKKAGLKVANMVIRCAPEYYNALVSERNEQVSMQAITKYLDMEGLLHCKVCPKRYGLRRLSGDLLCPYHFEKVNKFINSKKLEALKNEKAN